jgi:hypothetical protein
MAHHTGLVVASYKAGKVKIASFIEGPKYVTSFPRWYVGHVRFAVFHVGKLQHQCGVCVKLLLGAYDKFMQHLPRIFDIESYGFAQFDGNFAGCKAHIVAHTHCDGALNSFGIACNTPVFLFFFYHLILECMYCISVCPQCRRQGTGQEQRYQERSFGLHIYLYVVEEFKK